MLDVPPTNKTQSCFSLSISCCNVGVYYYP